MGLEPTNLLTASQALYQLSYAPEWDESQVRESGPGAEQRPQTPYAAILQPGTFPRTSGYPTQPARALLGEAHRVPPRMLAATCTVAAWSTSGRTWRQRSIETGMDGVR